MSTEAIKRAVEIVGTQRKLAEGIGRFLGRKIPQQTVSYWVRREVAIEAEYWPAIEYVTKGKVTRKHLRPEIFESVI